MSNIESTQATEYMLTTVDNPFNPFTRFEYDMRLGYNTSAFLDRIARVSPDLSDPDQALAVQNAIDEIVSENVSGMWRKVSRESAKEFEVQAGIE
jgi:hypothetical protein